MNHSAALLIAVPQTAAMNASASGALRSPQNNRRLMEGLLRDLEFDAVHAVERASRAEILAGVEALASGMALEGPTRAVIHFSGHGGVVAGAGPVLCAADTRSVDGRLQGLVSVAELVAIFERLAPETPLTLLLDTCGTPLLPARSLPSAQDAGLRPQDLLLTASAPGTPGEELELHGAWFGAFTWALDLALRAFARRDAGLPCFDASVDTLLQRCADLLAGLSLAQRPHCVGDGSQALFQGASAPVIRPAHQLRCGGRATLQVNEAETGILTGGESLTVLYALHHNGSKVGDVHMVYESATNRYSDLWSVNPDSFNAGTLSFHYVSTSASYPAPSPMWKRPMMAWKKNAIPADFQDFSVPPGAKLWCLSAGGKRQAYMVIDAGGVSWLMEKRCYDGPIPELLPALPFPGGPGAKVLAGDVALSFQKVPSVTLTGVLLAKPV